MPIDIKIDTRIAKIEVLEQDGSLYKVKIDNRVYDLDIEKVAKGAYSVIYGGKSINMEMIEGITPNHYEVNTISNYYEIEVIDAAKRYQSKSKSSIHSEDNIISTPMPGKIVKILVQEGDVVAKGDTLVIVSAMKMESEYKSPKDGIVHKIFVKEGAPVQGHQSLIEITNY